MKFTLLTVTAVFGLLQAVSAGFDCSHPVRGLSVPGCQHMSAIGFAGQGANPTSGPIWIGDQGPNKLVFTAAAGVSITLIFWQQTDYVSSFMNVRAPVISYTIYDRQSVTISMTNGVSGAWAGLYNLQTGLNNGQVHNTWGEITTGQYGTFDISREVHMGGNGMNVNVAGCTSDMNRCCFQCKSGGTCGASGTYNLNECAIGSQAGATYGISNDNPSGGCTGFSNGGTIRVNFTV